MKKVEIFSFARLRNNDHYQFMTDVDKLFGKYNAASLGIEAEYSGFKNALIVEDSVMRVEIGSSKSSMIDALDTQRDVTWNAINNVVKAFLMSPKEVEVQSATVLKRVIDLYGDPRALSYNEESAAIANFVGDMLLPANVPHVERLHMTDWVTILKTQNDKFQEILNERNAEFANRGNGDARQARKQIDPLYEAMVEKINALIVLGHSTE
ncbi:MAG TPA: DUF6261 family protein, partial [Bacteroidales bacterium]|nr:DUF6261 family protein [Bacteroidales bacterium]